MSGKKKSKPVFYDNLTPSQINKLLGHQPGGLEDITDVVEDFVMEEISSTTEGEERVKALSGELKARDLEIRSLRKLIEAFQLDQRENASRRGKSVGSERIWKKKAKDLNAHLQLAMTQIDERDARLLKMEDRNSTILELCNSAIDIYEWPYELVVRNRRAYQITGVPDNSLKEGVKHAVKEFTVTDFEDNVLAFEELPLYIAFTGVPVRHFKLKFNGVPLLVCAYPKDVIFDKTLNTTRAESVIIIYQEFVDQI